MRYKPSQRRPVQRLPEWLKVPLPKGDGFFHLRSLVQEHGLHTVCESATCPNIGKCWDSGTLTIMILGDHCSRACRFCDVPSGQLKPLDPNEPWRVADMLAKLDLRYVVITSVDRDDLADGGAGQWAEILLQVSQKSPHFKLDPLTPNFEGKASPIEKVSEPSPNVLSHNL